MRDGSGWGEVRGQRSKVRGQIAEVNKPLQSDLCDGHYSGTHSTGAKNATIDLTVATPYFT
jgi:hypothetical protein